MSRSICCVALFGVLIALCVLIPTPAQGGHVRPKSASPLRMSLVPAYTACTAPNRTHGPPLGFPSCSPPESPSAVTVGTPDANGAPSNSTGFVRLKVMPGPVGPPDDSDVAYWASITDIRCASGTTACGPTNAAGGADYAGDLESNGTIRITDHCNHTVPISGCAADSATVVDLPFPVVIPCAATAATSVGSVCAIETTMNAVEPGAVKEAERMTVEVDQLQVRDGGPDGSVSTSPNTLFAVQGVFVP